MRYIEAAILWGVLALVGACLSIALHTIFNPIVTAMAEGRYYP